jgi:protein SCO1/2
VDQFSVEPISPDFIHTSRFVLLDRNIVVRGYYDGLDKDSTSLSQLARDIGLLMLEKDKTKKSELFLEIIDLKWLWAIVVLIVAIFVVVFYRNRNN